MIKQDLLKTVTEQNVKFIELQFTDIFGQFKNVAMPVKQLEKALDNKCMFDGSSVEGFARIEESDMYLVPDINSFLILPYINEEHKTARLICDVYTDSGKPFEGCPRFVLKKVLKQALEMGFTVNIGPECEFFLFNMDKNGKPLAETSDTCGYFDLAPVDIGDNCRKQISLALEKMNFEIEASHHENAPGQHEIDFKYDEALKAADNIMTFKTAVKTIAMQNGLFASFMPKPKCNMAGSGMHVNISLASKTDAKNLFYDEKDKNGLSGTAMSFIAGVIKHAPAFTAITNPLVNSYKRLVPGYEAPVYIAYSFRNRSPLVRIPVSRGNSTRVELRSPDPSCNPYLSLALIIAAGISGIKDNLKPTGSVDVNIFELTEAERTKLNISTLPGNLEVALNEFTKSEFIKNTLGSHITSIFASAKRKEWDDYKIQITAWELENYLPKY